jgi:hypothetical protein
MMQSAEVVTLFFVKWLMGIDLSMKPFKLFALPDETACNRKY